MLSKPLWSLPHTAIASEKTRELLQIYFGRMRIRIWLHSSNKPTTVKTIRTIICRLSKNSQDLIPKHFSDWKDSTIVFHLQNILDFLCASETLLTDTALKTNLTNSQFLEVPPVAKYPWFQFGKAIMYEAMSEACFLGKGNQPYTMSTEFTPKCKPHWAVEHDNKNPLT